MEKVLLHFLLKDIFKFMKKPHQSSNVAVRAGMKKQNKNIRWT